MGRHRRRTVGREARPRALQRVSRRARIRRRERLRRGLLQRAPPERLRPHAVAEPDRVDPHAAHHEARDLRDGQLARALQPADPGRRGVRHARLHVRRPADRRLPGRHAHGHHLRLRPEPVEAARPVLRSTRHRHEGVARTRDLLVQRPIQPVALRQRLATARAGTPSAGVDPRGRLGGDLALVRRDGLRLQLPVVLRLQGRRGDDAGLLGRDGPARQGPQSVPGWVPAVRRGGRDRAGGARALSRTGRVLLRPLSARQSQVGFAGRIPVRGDDSRQGAVAGRTGRASVESGRGPQAGWPDGRGPGMEGHPRSRLRDRRGSRPGRRAHPRGMRQPQRRAPDAAVPVRQHVARNWRSTTRACTPRRCCRRSPTCSTTIGRTTGGRSR